MQALLTLTVLASASPDWEAWKAEHGKAYTAEEDARRSAIFEENRIYIKKYNEANNGVTLEMNHFGDLSTTEFGEIHLSGYVPSKEARYGGAYLGTHVHDGSDLPDSIDWNDKGAVTAIKNQGQCGSCWAFSTTGSMEGAWFVKTGKLVALSEQQLVDCSKSNHGCQGGAMDNGFTFEESVNVCTEDSYPYKGVNGQCKTSCTTGIPKKGVTGFKDVQQNSEEALMSALAQQPVSIAIEADKSVFQFYKSGVLTSTCGTKLDHGVLAVGFGTQNGQKYWKVKNSWGATWGAEGFILLQRGKGGSGECGLLQDASYPIVDGSAPPGPPSPGPSPSPPSPPPSPSGGSHYGKPPCLSDEMEAQIQGVDGVLCTPKCTGTTCPTDVPAGTTDAPKCVLQDQSGNHYCAITCLLGGCPTGATCKHVSLMTGLCMFPSGEYATSATTVSLSEGSTDMVI